MLNLIIVKSNLSQNEKEMWSSWVLEKQKWYQKYFSLNLKLYMYQFLYAAQCFFLDVLVGKTKDLFFMRFYCLSP